MVEHEINFRRILYFDTALDYFFNFYHHLVGKYKIQVKKSFLKTL